MWLSRLAEIPRNFRVWPRTVTCLLIRGRHRSPAPKDQLILARCRRGKRFQAKCRWSLQNERRKFNYLNISDVLNKWISRPFNKQLLLILFTWFCHQKAQMNASHRLKYIVQVLARRPIIARKNECCCAAVTSVHNLCLLHTLSCLQKCHSALRWKRIKYWMISILGYGELRWLFHVWKRERERARSHPFQTWYWVGAGVEQAIVIKGRDFRQHRMIM